MQSGDGSLLGDHEYNRFSEEEVEEEKTSRSLYSPAERVKPLHSNGHHQSNGKIRTESVIWDITDEDIKQTPPPPQTPSFQELNAELYHVTNNSTQIDITPPANGGGGIRAFCCFKTKGPENLSLEEQKKITDLICATILTEVFDTYKKQNWPRAIGIISASFLAAAGATSTSGIFGHRFVVGFNKFFGTDLSGNGAEVLAWTIAFSNFPAQGSLTMSSVWDCLSSLSNWIDRPKHKAINRYLKSTTWMEKLFLLNVPFSCFSSGKVVFQGLSGSGVDNYGWPKLPSGLLAGFSSSSSFAVNLNFGLNQIGKWRGIPDNVPVMLILEAAINRLAFLEKTSFEEFLIELDNKSLLKNLNEMADGTSGDYYGHMAKIFDALLDLAQVELKPPTDNAPGLTYNDDEDSEQEASCSDACISRLHQAKNHIKGFSLQNAIVIATFLIAGFVSLSNAEAGIEVPSMFDGVTTATSLDGYLDNFFSDFNYVTVLSGLLGLASEIMNIVINQTALLKLVGSVHALGKKIKKEKSKILSELPPFEIFMLFAFCITSAGYGGGKGGLTEDFSAIKKDVFIYINLVLSTIVFFGLGYVSQKGLFATMLDRYDRSLVKQALNNPNGLHEFYNCQPIDKQKLLVRLINNNCFNLLAKMLFSFKRFHPEAFENMLNPQLVDRMMKILNPEIALGRGVDQQPISADDEKGDITQHQHRTPPKNPATAVSVAPPSSSSLGTPIRTSGSGTFHARSGSRSPQPSIVRSNLSIFRNDLSISSGKESPTKPKTPSPPERPSGLDATEMSPSNSALSEDKLILDQRPRSSNSLGHGPGRRSG